MPLRFSIAVAALAAALAYTLFKIYQARPGARLGSVGSPEAQQLQEVLKSIPAGRVMTFASLAAHLDSGWTTRKIARQIRALANQESVPWWRAVRRGGNFGRLLPESSVGTRQQQLLAEEGVIFKDGGFPLAEYQWNPTD